MTTDMTAKKPMLLVTLTPSQIALAKAENGERLKITHALVCGRHGQMFGTEKQCRKYYDVWKRIFAELFSEARECSDYAFADYVGNRALVMKLIEASDKGKRVELGQLMEVESMPDRAAGRSWWSKLFGSGK